MDKKEHKYGTVKIRLEQEIDYTPLPNDFINKIYKGEVTESELNIYLDMICSLRKKRLQQFYNEVGIDYGTAIQRVSMGAYYGDKIMSLIKITLDSIIFLNKAERDIIETWYKYAK